MVLGVRVILAKSFARIHQVNRVNWASRAERRGPAARRGHELPLWNADRSE